MHIPKIFQIKPKPKLVVKPYKNNPSRQKRNYICKEMGITMKQYRKLEKRLRRVIR